MMRLWTSIPSFEMFLLHFCRMMNLWYEFLRFFFVIRSLSFACSLCVVELLLSFFYERLLKSYFSGKEVWLGSWSSMLLFSMLAFLFPVKVDEVASRRRRSSGAGKVDFTRQFHSRHFYNKYKIMFRDRKIEPFIIVETCRGNMQAKLVGLAVF